MTVIIYGNNLEIAQKRVYTKTLEKGKHYYDKEVHYSFDITKYYPEDDSYGYKSGYLVVSKQVYHYMNKKGYYLLLFFFTAPVPIIPIILYLLCNTGLEAICLFSGCFFLCLYTGCYIDNKCNEVMEKYCNDCGLEFEEDYTTLEYSHYKYFFIIPIIIFLLLKIFD
jgi:hypothetical protein